MYPDPLEIPQDWKKGGRVHNWQNYVGENVRALWPGLSDELKLAIAKDADEQAGNEEWE